MLTTQAVYCAQNKYTFISIHTFVRYAKEASGNEAKHWFSMFRQKKTSTFTERAAIFFEAITDISSDAESREEQNGIRHFVIGATTAKLWPLF